MKTGYKTLVKTWQKALSMVYSTKFLLNKVQNVSDKTKGNKYQKGTVLLVEPNNCHTELLPSYVKYLKDLGYEVEIAVSVNQKGFLPELLGVKKIYFLMLKSMRALFKTEKLKDYELVIFTSYRLYYPRPNEPNPALRPYSTISEQFEIKYPPRLGALFVLHHLEDYDETIKNAPCAVVLADILRKEENLYTINPCYFTENTPKNKAGCAKTRVDGNPAGIQKTVQKTAKKTIFITTGILNPDRKNADLLFSTARSLIQNGVKDFEIKVVGDNKKNIVPKDLKRYIEIKGRLDFKRLYKELQTSDFYLPLLDPDLKEHKRYLENGTSGSFQLIRGFLLPPVIHKTFAEAYNFNSSNSIIYKDNEDMQKAMEKAVNTDNERYLALQNELLNSREEIIKTSIGTLQTLFETLEERKL